MTVSRNPVRSSIYAQPIVAFNIILACLCAGGLAYYISGANSIASQEYHISALRSQISHLNEQQSALTAEKSATENPTAAALYAQSRHMIEAKDITYVFESGNVALQR